MIVNCVICLAQVWRVAPFTPFQGRCVSYTFGHTFFRCAIFFFFFFCSMYLESLSPGSTCYTMCDSKINLLFSHCFVLRVSKLRDAPFVARLLPPPTTFKCFKLLRISGGVVPDSIFRRCTSRLYISFRRCRFRFIAS